MQQTVRSQTQVNDNMRRWIAENLILGVPPQQLTVALMQQGVAQHEAQHEITLATNSPYAQGARQASDRLKNRIRKFGWILDIYRTLNKQNPAGGVIDRHHKLSREAFYRDYYFQNKPVVISGMMEDWPALEKWNFNYLRENFGTRVVEVQMERSKDPNYEINGPQHKQKMSLGEYLDKVEAAGVTNDMYMTANNGSNNRAALAELWPDLGKTAEYLDPTSTDDGFLWIGPAGTKTPLHHDLTNNFMAQIVGKKRVTIIPACETAYMYNHIHCYTPVDGFAVDYQRFPMMREVQTLQCDLGPGELLFLPVGCWHCVEGLTPSVTVSLINFQPDNRRYSAIYTTYQDV